MPYPGITFRPFTEADLPFLYKVYASTRAAEMAMVNWPKEEVKQFLDMQFNAQHTHYMKHYKGDEFLVIELEGERVGRLYIGRWKTQIRVIDIAILPKFQKKGIGGALMQDILDEGRESGRKVSIHVEKNNPALRLYNRLGFKVAGDVEVYHYMEWVPDTFKHKESS